VNNIIGASIILINEPGILQEAEFDEVAVQLKH
jgi:hypothetical protein